MVAGLLVSVFLLVMQVALTVHVRNVATANAVEGARLAARDGTDLAQGRERTVELLSRALTPAYARDVAIARGDASGVPVVQVTVTVPVPVVGLWGTGSMTVRGRAYDESAA